MIIFSSLWSNQSGYLAGFEHYLLSIIFIFIINGSLNSFLKNGGILQSIFFEVFFKFKLLINKIWTKLAF